MIKKIILVIATFAIASIAFVIYTWREDPVPAPTQANVAQPTTRRADSRPRSTQPVVAMERGSQSFTFNTSIPPGEAPKIRFFDERTGEEKYSFQASYWEHISETDFV